MASNLDGVSQEIVVEKTEIVADKIVNDNVIANLIYKGMLFQLSYIAQCFVNTARYPLRQCKFRWCQSRNSCREDRNGCRQGS